MKDKCLRVARCYNDRDATEHWSAKFARYQCSTVGLLDFTERIVLLAAIFLVHAAGHKQ